MQYRFNYQWKGLYRLLLLMCTILSSCASRVRVAAAGEVAGDLEWASQFLDLFIAWLKAHVNVQLHNLLFPQYQQLFLMHPTVYSLHTVVLWQIYTNWD